jgi:hypothetical protein
MLRASLITCPALHCGAPKAIYDALTGMHLVMDTNEEALES